MSNKIIGLDVFKGTTVLFASETDAAKILDYPVTNIKKAVKSKGGIRVRHLRMFKEEDFETHKQTSEVFAYKAENVLTGEIYEFYAVEALAAEIGHGHPLVREALKHPDCPIIKGNFRVIGVNGIKTTFPVLKPLHLETFLGSKCVIARTENFIGKRPVLYTNWAAAALAARMCSPVLKKKLRKEKEIFVGEYKFSLIKDNSVVLKEKSHERSSCVPGQLYNSQTSRTCYGQSKFDSTRAG